MRTTMIFAGLLLAAQGLQTVSADAAARLTTELKASIAVEHKVSTRRIARQQAEQLKDHERMLEELKNSLRSSLIIVSSAETATSGQTDESLARVID